jgi:hypothetical protein
MARKRYNNAGGVLGATLSGSGTTITFATVPPFATLVSPDYVPLVIEPATGASPSANFEIVHLTAYTVGATTGTVQRGQEGTTATAHNNGAVWGVVPTAQDFGTSSPPTRVFRDTPAQGSVTTGQWTKVQLTGVTFDAINAYDETTNYRYTAPVAGDYQVAWRVQFLGTLASDQMSALYKNGAAVAFGGEGTLMGSGGSDIVQLAAGDYLELWAWATGTGLSIGNGAHLTYLAVNPLPN